MRFVYFLSAVLVACVLALNAGVAHADNFEQYCGLPDLSVPLRQTVILIDELHVYPEVGKQPDQRNLVWRKFLGNLLLSDENTLEQNFLPRERVTIALAKRDGTGVRTIFVGCLPFYSADEKKALAQSAGSMQYVNNFFGTGPLANVKRDIDLFRIRMGDAISAGLQPSMLSSANIPHSGGDLAANGFVTSLKQGALVNLTYGIPRFIIFSDMSRYLENFPSERTKVCALALEKAKNADLDFKNAEVYVVGLTGNAIARNALGMFFLASHGELISTGAATSMPTFQSPPSHVVYYQGLIQYPDNRFPIRIRLATDQNGTVVNSWLSVKTSKEQFSPIHGVVTCQSNGSCIFTGDDVFAQIWNVSRNAGTEPLFDPSLPFAGARSLNFVESGTTVTGSISDTLLHFQGLKDNKLEFDASRQANARF
jgi:hypothetical protein